VQPRHHERGHPARPSVGIDRQHPGRRDVDAVEPRERTRLPLDEVRLLLEHRGEHVLAEHDGVARAEPDVVDGGRAASSPGAGAGDRRAELALDPGEHGRVGARPKEAAADIVAEAVRRFVGRLEADAGQATGHGPLRR
jgi:hypothetical protein